MNKDDLLKNTYSEAHKEAEENAIEKFEKGAKSYRPLKYRPIPQQIKCAKCGATYGTLVKVEDYWFCNACIQQRMRELKSPKM